MLPISKAADRALAVAGLNPPTSTNQVGHQYKNQYLAPFAVKPASDNCQTAGTSRITFVIGRTSPCLLDWSKRFSSEEFSSVCSVSGIGSWFSAWSNGSSSISAGFLVFRSFENRKR